MVNDKPIVFRMNFIEHKGMSAVNTLVVHAEYSNNSVSTLEHVKSTR